MKSSGTAQFQVSLREVKASEKTGILPRLAQKGRPGKAPRSFCFVRTQRTVAVGPQLDHTRGPEALEGRFQTLQRESDFDRDLAGTQGPLPFQEIEDLLIHIDSVSRHSHSVTSPLTLTALTPSGCKTVIVDECKRHASIHLRTSRQGR